MGSSYGGFAPANLETLARSMPPSWASVIATMFGDPDTDADELRARSP